MGSSQYRKFLAVGFAALATALPGSGSGSSCRVLPGDADWPKLQDWQDLNKTVDGRLIGVIPRESVCHDAPYNRYDAEACAALQKRFDFPILERYEETQPPASEPLCLMGINIAMIAWKFLASSWI